MKIFQLLKRSTLFNCRNFVVPQYHSLHKMSISKCTNLHRVALTQMTSTEDKDANFHTCADLVKRAAKSGAQMVFLPEACDYIAGTVEDSVNKAESIEGPLVSKFKMLAHQEGVWLSLGGLHIKEEGEKKIRNTHIIINDKGDVVSTYTKVHLFSIDIPEKKLHIYESTFARSGQAIHTPVSSPVGEVALSICYDLRFPEMSMIQRRLGAQILTFPSAFTVPTGTHWEALLKARAIETQCYVIAAAQTGKHNKKRTSYGNAMIIDPWGDIECHIQEGTDVAFADIDLIALKSIRERMPVMSHRRMELYHITEPLVPTNPRICNLNPFPSPYISYQFGETSVPGSCVFLKSQLSQAFVNKKPILPGHILVAPERPAKSLTNLTAAEISDLAQMIQSALKVLMNLYNSEMWQVAIQDGPAAGQTISHLHIHIVPQGKNCMKKLQGHELKDSRQPKEKEEMEEEASQLRHVVTKILPDLSKDIYDIPKPLEIQDPVFAKTFQYGLVEVPSETLILKTKYSCAFMVPKPILPGHVYVTSLKQYKGFRETNPEIVTDLFLTMQLAGKIITEFNPEVSSCTYVMLEDLNTLLQTKHLQVHIIPRIEGDLEHNDDIYTAVLDHHNWMSTEVFSKELMAHAHQLRNAVNSELSSCEHTM